MKNKKFAYHVSIFSVLFAVVLVWVALNMPTYADWEDDCLGFGGGHLNVTVGQICTLTSHGSATSITVDSGGILNIEGELIVYGEVIVEGNLNVDVLGSVEIQTANNLTVQNGGTVVNDGGFEVNQITYILDDSSKFTNNGSLETYKLFIGNYGAIDGGEFINNGTVNVTCTADEDSIFMHDGQFFNVNPGLVSPSLTYRARMWLQGTVAEGSIFRNHGLVDAGENWLFVMDYSLLDLKAGSRFVMNKDRCNDGLGGGNMRLESAAGAYSDSLINIDPGAVLSADFIEVGWGPTPASGQIVNNGTIDKVAIDGNPMDCPVEFRLYRDSVIDNKIGGLIDLGENGNIEMYANSVFNNKVGATITGEEPSSISLRDTGVVFNQDGTIQGVKTIQMGSNSEEGGTFNFGGSSVTQVKSFTVGNQTGDTGGIVNLDAGGEIILDGSFVVEGNGKLYADGHIEAGNFMIMSGDASAPTVELRNITEDYNFKALVIETPKAPHTAKLDIDPGATVNITESIYNPGDGFYYSAVIGLDNNDGAVIFNLDGTLNVANDPVNPVKFLINDVNALFRIRAPGLLDIDEVDGSFEVNAKSPYGIVDTSVGVDVECAVLIDGYYETHGGLDAVGLLHIKSNGYMYSGRDSVVTVEGSETIVEGFYELDGTLNAGNLTVKSGGRISSGDDPLQVDTNFLINAVDVIVESGGKIASDGVSSYGVHTGPGSYGGEGMNRGAASIYGQVKMDETFTPLYGEAGKILVAPAVIKGGGGVRIHSTGNMTIDGLVSASGDNATAAGECGGAGGTVIIVHEPTDPGAFFKGSGDIHANGNGSSVFGGNIGAGGGRISIISPFLDNPDMDSYDFTGYIEAGGGANLDGDSGAAGTIYFGGDRHNPKGTLIVNQLGQPVPGTEVTRIPNIGDIIFDRVEVLGGGNITWEADPATPPVVCYATATNGTITFNDLGLICADYAFGDKPDTLYIGATSAQGVNPKLEPGYQATPGVKNTNLVVAAERPVFSVMYRNPANPLAINKIQIQIDDNADFTSPVWDYEKDNLKKADGNPVGPNERTQDIQYNEDGTAISALIPGTTYYIRVRFISNPPGLWSHGDYNDQYRFTTNPPSVVPEQPAPVAGGRAPGFFFPQPQPEPEEEPAPEPEPETQPEPETETPPATQPEPEPEIPTQTPVVPETVPQPEPEPQLEEESEPVERIKVPVKRPAAEETAYGYSEGAIPGCTRADITKRILTEFNLYEILREKDEKCVSNWNYCMLPFIVHSNYNVTEDSYYPDVFEDFKDDIFLATRSGIVSGYYEEQGSPFKPYENMSRIEILKLLNWVAGQRWIYYEEFMAQIGGAQNLSQLERYAKDISEWWHLRYHNYACENGLLECDPEANFVPNETCSVEWMDETIAKYKVYYEANGLVEKGSMDTDNDLISDDDEKNIYLTDFEVDDTDGDGVKDGEEVNIYKTNPLLTDSDYDSLSDGDEILVHKTNPLNPDTDGDGVPDGIEVLYGSDPNNPESKPSDINGNGISDEWEAKYQIEPSDGTVDTDGDGLSDLLEYRYGTNPLNPDTDGDGLSDAQEVLLYLTNPLEYTDLAQLGVQITNIKDGMIITDKYPVIRGFAPKAGMEILVIIKNEFGQELLIGKTIADENEIFELKSDFELQDGQFYIMAKGMDTENSNVLNSRLIFVTLNSSLNVDDPKPERISTKNITSEVLLEGLRVEVDDNKPVLYGRSGYKDRVIATWQSVIGVSSIVADFAGGEFKISAPEEMALGQHKVTVYSVREVDQAMSKEIMINFEIVEKQIQAPVHEVAEQPEEREKEEFPMWIILSVGGVLIVAGGIGTASFVKRKRRMDTPL